MGKGWLSFGSNGYSFSYTPRGIINPFVLQDNALKPIPRSILSSVFSFFKEPYSLPLVRHRDFKPPFSSRKTWKAILETVIEND